LPTPFSLTLAKIEGFCYSAFYMLMIRFQRIGRTNDPAFRIVVLEKERAAKAGNIVELLGTYNPRSKALTLNEEQVKHWISKGAQPTGSIHNLLITKGVITGKKVNVLSKHRRIEKVGVPTEASGKTEEPAPAAETPVAEELPTEAEVVAEAVPAAPAAEAPAAVEETPAA
jgi:small subunit ribosomal protein S16